MAKLTRFIPEGYCYHTISATRGRRPVFANPAFAQILMDSIRFIRQEKKAFILAYAIMPDHLHLIAVPQNDATISELMHAIKGYSARQINRAAGSRGALWQQSFYDRVIRDEEQLNQTIAYVEGNPVTSGLATEPWAYRFSSAHPNAETDIGAWLDALGTSGARRGWKASATAGEGESGERARRGEKAEA